MSWLPDAFVLWWQGLPFSFPLGLALLLLIPLAFIVLLLRRHRLDVGSLLLFRDLPQRTLFQNVNLEHQWHRWIYAAIFLVLGLIAAGLSLPQPGLRHLIVVDDSASMAAWIDPFDHNAGQIWDKAKDQAKAAAQASEALGRAVVMIRLSDFRPFDIAESDASDADNQDRIAALAQDGTLGRQLAALETAAPRLMPIDTAERIDSLGSVAGGQGFGRVTVITDRPFAASVIDAQSAVEWIDVAEGVGAVNLAITAVEESQSLFDKASMVVIQNTSDVPVSNVRLVARSIRNPVNVPLISNITFAPNERLTFQINRLRNRANALGSGPIRLSVQSQADALPVDNHLWMVKESNPPMQVAMVQCQGNAPLFESLNSNRGISISYFGDVTALDEAQENMSLNPEDNDPLPLAEGLENAVNAADLFATDESGLDSRGGRFESFDLVVYDRCERSPLYEELETDSIVIETVVSQLGQLDSVDEGDAENLIRVNWQAPASRSPVLRGVRSLVGMPLASQTVRPLPNTHQVVGLLSDLDPSSTAGQAEQDVFAPSDLLQAYVAWNGMKSVVDEQTGLEVAQSPDRFAPKMLYMGFDPHLGCVEDVISERQDGVPLFEALASAQNGPDNCLTLSLMVVNAIEWMRDTGVSNSGSSQNGASGPVGAGSAGGSGGAVDAGSAGGSGGAVGAGSTGSAGGSGSAGSAATAARAGGYRQYLSTGETISIRSAESDAQQVAQRERLTRLPIVEGEAGVSRHPLTPLNLSSITTSDQSAAVSSNRVRWLVEDRGLHRYQGTREGFDVSVELLDADESRLDRSPITAEIIIRGAAAGAGKQDLIRLLVLILVTLMALEMAIVAWRALSGRGFGSKGFGSSGLGGSPLGSSRLGAGGPTARGQANQEGVT